MADTSIEWTDKTWNPTRGCSLVSPGCTNCYAMKFAHRFSGKGGRYEGLTRLRTKGGPVWTGKVRSVPEMLEAPLRWKKPRKVFVNSMSDLFHEDVSFDFIAAVFGVMASTPHHTYQVLTKRPENMRRWFELMARAGNVQSVLHQAVKVAMGYHHKRRPAVNLPAWPLPNVWLGVSCESQAQVERLDMLRQVPAVVRFVSFEPLLGPIERVNLEGIHWTIMGGESGRQARPCALEWIESLVRQTLRAGAAPFVKQLGSYVVSEHRTAPKELMSRPDELEPYHFAPNGEVWAWRAGLTDSAGSDLSSWPLHMQVRQWPTPAGGAA